MANRICLYYNRWQAFIFQVLTAATSPKGTGVYTGASLGWSSGATGGIWKRKPRAFYVNLSCSEVHEDEVLGRRRRVRRLD